MDLEKAALATAAVGTNKRALPAVACPDRAFDRGGHMTRAWTSVAWRARAAGMRASSSLQVCDEQLQRAFDNPRRIATWDRVSQQILGTAQVVVRFR